MWQRKVQDDPYGARDLLQTGDVRHSPGSNTTTGWRLEEADREIKRIEGEAKADARERKAEARAAKQDLAIAQGFSTADMQDRCRGDGRRHQRWPAMDPATLKRELGALDAQIGAAVEPGNKRRLMDMRQALHAANDGGDYAATAAGLPTPHLQKELERLETTPIDPNERTPEADKLKTVARILGERTEAVRTGKVLDYAAGTRVLAAPLAPVDWHDPQSAVDARGAGAQGELCHGAAGYCAIPAADRARGGAHRRGHQQLGHH